MVDNSEEARSWASDVVAYIDRTYLYSFHFIPQCLFFPPLHSLSSLSPSSSTSSFSFFSIFCYYYYSIICLLYCPFSTPLHPFIFFFLSTVIFTIHPSLLLSFPSPPIDKLSFAPSINTAFNLYISFLLSFHFVSLFLSFSSVIPFILLFHGWSTVSPSLSVSPIYPSNIQPVSFSFNFQSISSLHLYPFINSFPSILPILSPSTDPRTLRSSPSSIHLLNIQLVFFSFSFQSISSLHFYHFFQFIHSIPLPSSLPPSLPLSLCHPCNILLPLSPSYIPAASLSPSPIPLASLSLTLPSHPSLASPSSK